MRLLCLVLTRNRGSAAAGSAIVPTFANPPIVCGTVHHEHVPTCIKTDLSARPLPRRLHQINLIWIVSIKILVSQILAVIVIFRIRDILVLYSPDIVRTLNRTMTKMGVGRRISHPG